MTFNELILLPQGAIAEFLIAEGRAGGEALPALYTAAHDAAAAGQLSDEQRHRWIGAARQAGDALMEEAAALEREVRLETAGICGVIEGGRG